MQPASTTQCHFCNEEISRHQAIHQPGGEGHPMHSVCMEIILKIFPKCPVEGCSKPTENLKAVLTPVQKSGRNISEEEEKAKDVERCEQVIALLDEQFRRVFDEQNPEQHLAIFNKMMHVACIQSTLLDQPMQFIEHASPENEPAKASVLP